MNIADILDAISKFTWPVMAAIVFWKLYPSLRRIIESRGFTIKIGDMEISVQEAAEQLRKQVEDLQEKVSALRIDTGHAAAVKVELRESIASGKQPLMKHILWVDDHPQSNVYSVAKLRGMGVVVTEATSTAEALQIIESDRQRFSAIISDMGRLEGGVFRPTAGLDLINAVRTAGLRTPIFVFSAPSRTEGIRDNVLRAGGNGATASSIELFEMLSIVLKPNASTG